MDNFEKTSDNSLEEMEEEIRQYASEVKLNTCDAAASAGSLAVAMFEQNALQAEIIEHTAFLKTTAQQRAELPLGDADDPIDVALDQELREVRQKLAAAKAHFEQCASSSSSDQWREIEALRRLSATYKQDYLQALKDEELARRQIENEKKQAAELHRKQLFVLEGLKKRLQEAKASHKEAKEESDRLSKQLEMLQMRSAKKRAPGRPKLSYLS